MTGLCYPLSGTLPDRDLDSPEDQPDQGEDYDAAGEQFWADFNDWMEAGNG